jgi:hypothetical protein
VSCIFSASNLALRFPAVSNESQLYSCLKDAARAKQLRAKFEKWENSKDAQDQARQIMIHDENGDSLETAGNLKARFEALKMQDTAPPPLRQKKFVPKRFKVNLYIIHIGISFKDRKW